MPQERRGNGEELPQPTLGFITSFKPHNSFVLGDKYPHLADEETETQ